MHHSSNAESYRLAAAELSYSFFQCNEPLACTAWKLAVAANMAPSDGTRASDHLHPQQGSTGPLKLNGLPALGLKIAAGGAPELDWHGN